MYQPGTNQAEATPMPSYSWQRAIPLYVTVITASATSYVQQLSGYYIPEPTTNQTKLLDCAIWVWVGVNEH